MASRCLFARREQISNSVCPSLSASSSRIFRLVGSARALNTSATGWRIGKWMLACQVGGTRRAGRDVAGGSRRGGCCEGRAGGAGRDGAGGSRRGGCCEGRTRASGPDGQQAPAARHSLQLVLAAVVELQSG